MGQKTRGARASEQQFPPQKMVAISSSSSNAPTYIAIRDDARIQSLVERDFILQHQHHQQQPNSGSGCLRVDGRHPGDRRPVSMALTRAENLATATIALHSSSGSGTNTRVTCTVTADLTAPPSLDRPNEGSIQFSVDISPSASTSYRLATPAATSSASTTTATGQILFADRHQTLTTNRILRCLERCLLQGGALDAEALCVVPGLYVWKLHCACTVLDDGGNLTDAVVLACLAAIRHYRKPVVEFNSSSNNSNNNSNSNSSTNTNGIPRLVPSHLKEPTPLPLHHTPLTISFAVFDGATSAMAANTKANDTHNNSNSAMSSSLSSSSAILMDPSAREELCQTGCLTVGMNVHQEICLMDFSGGCELSVAKLRACHAQAAAHIGPLCQSLETALTEADEKAWKDRLAQLQHQKLPSEATLLLPPSSSSLVLDSLEEDNAMFVTQTPASFVPSDAALDQAVAAQESALAAEEEAYRRQALDYNLGHVASKVRENSDKKSSHGPSSSSTGGGGGGSLLAAMLKSAKPQEANVDTVVTDSTESMDISQSLTSQTHGMVQRGAASLDANDEIPLPKPTNTKMLVDSDEEETPTQLKSEFDGVPHPPTEGSFLNTNNDGDNDDVDDLAAAVKTKKKGKRKK